MLSGVLLKEQKLQELRHKLQKSNVWHSKRQPRRLLKRLVS